MTAQPSIDPWHSSRWHSGLVSIDEGARQISATIAGQKRRPQADTGKLQPLVIIEAGLGGVAEEHVVVAQLIAPFARVLRYNRAGYGESTFRDGTPDTITAADRGRDLTLLLDKLELPPPYILVGQSFGGTFIREFLEQRGPSDIVGMVLVDCHPLIQGREQLERIIGALLGNGQGNYLEVVGLAANSILTPEQLEQLHKAEEIAEKNGTIAAETKVAVESQESVNRAQGMKCETNNDGWVTKLSFSKQSMGTGRMSVILGDFVRDFQSLIDYGKSHGFGDEQTYKDAAAYMDLCKIVVTSAQEAQLALTAGESRMIAAPGTGRTHNLQVTRPDVIAQEVRWVMEGAWDLTGS